MMNVKYLYKDNVKTLTKQLYFFSLLVKVFAFYYINLLYYLYHLIFAIKWSTKLPIVSSVMSMKMQHLINMGNQ